MTRRVDYRHISGTHADPLLRLSGVDQLVGPRTGSGSGSGRSRDRASANGLEPRPQFLVGRSSERRLQLRLAVSGYRAERRKVR